MEIEELKNELVEMNKKSQEGYRKSIGPKGGRNSQSDFYMGCGAILERVIRAIEKDDISILKGW